MKHRIMAALAVATLGVLGLATPAAATVPQGAHTVKSACTTEWYVNSDEEALLPEQKPQGFLFDGPSLAHRLIALPIPLATAPTNGSFSADLLVGVMPLFKMETLAPYSTINKTPGGKYWSSKIASGSGSQSSPVDTLAQLAVLAPYNVNTKLYSFGVGYANDAGNKALVKSVSYGGHTYSLACVPASSSASVTPSTSTPPVTTPPSSVAPTNSQGPGPDSSLPLTGTPVGRIALVGAVGVIAGIFLFVVGRRRRRIRIQ